MAHRHFYARVLFYFYFNFIRIVNLMEKETVLSAGIDIGTTTTHLVISRLGISETGGFGVVPSARITSKEIIYKSTVYFTPLLENGDIDLDATAKLIISEYKAAGISVSDLKCGAVIITGESARKGNSAKVLDAVAENSGDFVAAEAGSELESYLSGKGAGADKLSENTGKTVANIDIGGGTTNISVFENGICVDTCCLNIGGRLVKEESGGVYVSDTVKKLLADNDIKITDIEKDKTAVMRLCDIFADKIYTALNVSDGDIPDYLVTDHLLARRQRPELLTFSGGVAECMKEELSDYAFGDIGVLLGKTVLEKAQKYKCKIAQGLNDPIRATVIGAGQFSTELSGSTISYSDIKFPLKDLPCVSSLSHIRSSPCAFCPKGRKSPSFTDVYDLAKDIVFASEKLIKQHIPLVVITKEDYSKALGQCLKRLLPSGYPFLCADGIECRPGDYIDIGEPVAGGKAVPVVVKTLVFGG